MLYILCEIGQICSVMHPSQLRTQNQAEILGNCIMEVKFRTAFLVIWVLPDLHYSFGETGPKTTQTLCAN